MHQDLRRPVRVTDIADQAPSANFCGFHPPSASQRHTWTSNCASYQGRRKGSELAKFIGTSRETTTEGTDLREHGCKHSRPGIQRSDSPGVKKMHQTSATLCFNFISLVTVCVLLE